MIADEDEAMTSNRQAILKSRFSAAVDTLHRRHASDIPEADIAGYVALDWLEWHGGSLRVTTTGENVCRQSIRGRS